MMITPSAYPVSAPAAVQSSTSCSESESTPSPTSSAPSTPYVVVSVDNQYAKSAATTNVETGNEPTQTLAAVQDAYQPVNTEADETQVTYGLSGL